MFKESILFLAGLLLAPVDNVKPDFNVGITKKEDINKLLVTLSKITGNDKLSEEYNNGKIKCAFCNKSLKHGENQLGAIIPSEGKVLFLCKDNACYEKALMKIK